MEKRNKIWLCIIAATILAGVVAYIVKNHCEKQAQDPVEQQITALMSKMSLEEKIGQLNQVDGGNLDELIGQIRAGQVGCVFNVNTQFIDTLQFIAMNESPNGIPLLFARDVIHGYKTIFPVPLAQGATFNREMVEEACRITAVEASADGLNWTFSPMVDISRDPRWGRTTEGYGEDPYLTGEMGAASVRGYQKQGVAACVKHFCGYGASEGGRDYNTTWLPEIVLREVYLPPFKACADAGALSFMASFNEINGVPQHANPHTCREILRDEWGYDGVLDGDWGAIDMFRHHGIVDPEREAGRPMAARKALAAGVDMDMAARVYSENLVALAKRDKVIENQIDEACRRVLRMKYRLGLFSDASREDAKTRSDYAVQEHEKVALAVAEESIILLKNENNILPLQGAGGLRTIAVVGPLANDKIDQCGTWCFDGEFERSVTPLTAIRDYGKSHNLNIVYEPILTYSRERKENITIPASVRNADVILCFFGEEAIMSGEGKCMADLNPKGSQTAMINALAKTGKPLILILMAGRPLTIENEIAQSDAVLFALHGGTMAGPALANIIFGEVSPSGRLPITMPRLTGQVPIYYSRHQTGRPAHHDPRPLYDIPLHAPQFSTGDLGYYLDAGFNPMYPFGYGLSYTTFEYSAVELSDTIWDENMTAKCTIRNTGNRKAKEVVQCYLHDVWGEHATRPMRQLIGFQKIELDAGEEMTVEFPIAYNDLCYWWEEHDHLKQEVHFTADKGEFQIFIAPNSMAGEAKSFWLK